MKKRFGGSTVLAIMFAMLGLMPCAAQQYTVPITRLPNPNPPPFLMERPLVGPAAVLCQIGDPEGSGGIQFNVNSASAASNDYYVSNGIGAPVQAFGQVGSTETTANANCLNFIGVPDSVAQVDTLVTAKATITGGDPQTGSGWQNLAQSGALYRIDAHPDHHDDIGTDATLRGSLWLACVGPDPADIGNALNNEVRVAIGGSWVAGSYLGGGWWWITGVLTQSSEANPNAQAITVNLVAPGLDHYFECTQVVQIGIGAPVPAGARIWNNTGTPANGGAIPANHPADNYNLNFKGTAWFDVIK